MAYYVTEFLCAGPSTRVYRNIPGGNNEIRELQRLFPETQLAAQPALLKAVRRHVSQRILRILPIASLNFLERFYGNVFHAIRGALPISGESARGR